MNKILCFIAASLVFIAAPAWAKTLYVDINDGSCSNATTKANNDANNQWCTLGRAVWGNASRSSSDSGEAADAGDTVRVAAGTYSTSEYSSDETIPVYNPVNSGTSGNRIVFEASGTVILQGTGTGLRGGCGPLIGSYNHDYITWDGFTLNEANINVVGDTGPVEVHTADYITLQNLTLIGTTVTWADNHNAIRVEFADELLVKNCDISDFHVTGTSSRNGAAILFYHTNDAVIEFNKIHRNNSGIYIKGLNPGTVTIRYNWIEDNDSEGIAIGGSDSSRIYQNVIINNDSFGITYQFWSDPAPINAWVVNNTLYNNGTGQIYLKPSCEYGANNYIYNNIMVGATNVIYDECGSLSTSDIDFEHNNYHGNSGIQNGGSLASWQSAGHDASAPATTESDPLFTAEGADFTLQAGSPCREGQSNDGIDILDLDLDGSTVDAITIGAYITGNEEIGIESGEGDSTAPVVEITTSDPQNITSNTLAISGTASDAVGVTGCKFRVGAAPTESTGTAITGTTAWSGTATGFSEGANTLYVGCDDAANNWGSDSITVNFTYLSDPILGIIVSNLIITK